MLYFDYTSEGIEGGKMEDEQLLDSAFLAGKVLSLANAEANRIEDTMKRILTLSNYQSIDVLAQSSNIIVSLLDENSNRVTRMARMYGHRLALDKINAVNGISRELCERSIDAIEAQQRLTALLTQEDKLTIPVMLGLWALGPAFVLVFKGGFKEMIVVMILSILYVGLYRVTWKINILLLYLIASTLLAVGSIYFQKLAINEGMKLQFDIVIISAIMPMVPGITITNAFRDIMYQDYVSGMSKCMQSLTQAGSIALGIGLGYALGALL